MTVEITTTEKITCKHCKSDAVVKYGSYRGVPRYYCKVCKRKFKADDTLHRMHTPTSQIASALNLYFDGHSIRAIGRHFDEEHINNPSTETTYDWIQRYSQYLTDSIKQYPTKSLGNQWVCDETVLKIGGSQVWLWDVIDTHSRLLVASRLSRSRTTQDAQSLIDRAIKTAGKSPKTVTTDQLKSYLDVDYGKDAEHLQGSPFSHGEESTSKIERWHGTLKQRTKVMRGLKNFETANDFTQAYQAYYNYLRPHESLDGKTPAQVAGADYPYKTWDELIRNYKPTRKIIVTHVERERFRMPEQHVGRPRKARLSNPTTTARPANAIYGKGGLLSRRKFRGSHVVARAKRGKGLSL